MCFKNLRLEQRYKKIAESLPLKVKTLLKNLGTIVLFGMRWRKAYSLDFLVANIPMPNNPQIMTQIDCKPNTPTAKALASSPLTPYKVRAATTATCHGPNPPLDGTPILTLLKAKAMRPAVKPRSAVKSKAKNVM